MARLILFNKPYGVLSQFTPEGRWRALDQYIPVKGVYVAGRLDADSEGLLLLTDDGGLQARIAHPRFKLQKTYWVQVEGQVTDLAVRQLSRGVDLGDFRTSPADVEKMVEPTGLWPRDPPIRYRKSVPTEWLQLRISEGKNRQVRRMTAAVGYPTLRLIRAGIGALAVNELPPGVWSMIEDDATGLYQRLKGESQ